MFLCRSAQQLGRPFITHGLSSFQVPAAHGLRSVTLTLHKVHTDRVLCLSSFKGQISDGKHAKERERDTHSCLKWDLTRGFVSDWRRLDRIATIAVCLGSKSAQSRGWRGKLQVTRNATEADGRFPGISLLRSATGTSSMQTRASSSAAATKHREAAEERTVSDKGEEQPLKDPSPSPEQDSGKPEPEPEGDNSNKTQELKKVFQEYGAVGLSFHICTSLLSLGMVYLLMSSGIDMAALLCKLGFSETVVRSKMAAGTSTFVLAYAIHKLSAPLRISITLVSVPFIVRHFRKIGLFKPPPSAP